METLNEDDLIWLTKVQNKLTRMRKREAANANWSTMIGDITETIQSVDNVRVWLGSRIDVEVQSIGREF